MTLHPMRIVVITGMSGSGKSVALNVLEDDGFYCIDNLPARFVQDVTMALRDSGKSRVAVSIDARTGMPMSDLRQAVSRLMDDGHDVRVLFLNARTDTLVQRYSETRRRHPLAGGDLPDAEPEPTLMESIEREREIMADIQDMGAALDTSDMHPNVLRQWVRSVVGTDRATLTLLFESFAYKYGVPLDADLVFDARCLPNPYYDPVLRPLTGRDAPVAAYLASVPAAGRLVDHVAGFLDAWLPSYLNEHRSYVTVAVGCTGGQHRSVYCVERLAERFAHTEHVLVRHRSLSARGMIPS